MSFRKKKLKFLTYLRCINHIEYLFFATTIVQFKFGIVHLQSSSLIIYDYVLSQKIPYIVFDSETKPKVH